MAPLGVGGFGRVWKAHDEALGVHVAVKEVRLPQQAFSEAEHRERVVRAAREARNAARLRDHPHIVAVHDVVVEDGTPWIVMRLVDGPSLEERLRTGGPLPSPQVAEMATALLTALKAAHAAGIVHRDLKPANVMLAEDGHALLTDFGIAVHETDTRLTATGGVIGSAEYMAPERLDGSGDHATGDLFSLGVTLYEAVEGVSPFRRDTPTATIAAVAMHDPPPLRHADPVLASLIIALLAKDPAGRPTIDSTLAMLRAAPATSAMQASTAPMAPTLRQPGPPDGAQPLLAEERRRIRDREGPADRYRIALYCSLALFTLVCMVTFLAQIGSPDGLHSDYRFSYVTYPSAEDTSDFETRQTIFSWLLAAKVLSGVGLVTCWILWFACVRRLADRFAPGRLRYRPGMAVAGWFVPIGNLFLPKQIADDVWHASSTEGRAPATAGPLNTWWVAWLVTFVTWPLLWTPSWFLIRKVIDTDTDTDMDEDPDRRVEYELELDYDFGWLYWIQAVCHFLVVPVAVITVLYIRRLTAMQAAKLRR
ncbi:protein kinase domain-containing protein [Actinomadura algeriensis]|uniref:non-specific serine/threonine protein kinase n=1 Tax=Actinomadura algeriensis TaxID=1679523 RepID=A0ABR9JVG5_9ACTN|nr:protein kinase [Actinomadura algeriensis]MBE1534376.1 serine/threonine protein kinase [Actinomadura algeriensis]